MIKYIPFLFGSSIHCIWCVHKTFFEGRNSDSICNFGVGVFRGNIVWNGFLFDGLSNSRLGPLLLAPKK